jgi:hypothetical protein
MSDSHDRDAWRCWPRRGEGVVAPPGTSFAECLHAMWMLTCEEYGIDPENPPPMRKDVVRILRKGRPQGD